MSKGISETAFASQVEDLLEIGHWLWMHPRPARVLRHGKEIYETAYSGHKGFLDYICLRSPRIVVFELKDESKDMTPEQQEWFNLWEQCQRVIIIQPVKIGKHEIKFDFTDRLFQTLTIPEVYLFRPSDYERVLEILR